MNPFFHSASDDFVDCEEFQHLCELTRRIDTLTNRQIRDLKVVHNTDKVVLNGRSKSYYVKQLASQAVIDLMPGVAVENAIDVHA